MNNPGYGRAYPIAALRASDYKLFFKKQEFNVLFERSVAAAQTTRNFIDVSRRKRFLGLSAPKLLLIGNQDDSRSVHPATIICSAELYETDRRANYMGIAG
jgi:hypothetical protein